MQDQSHLDSKYFIDRYKYNCPFCNRRHVSYHIRAKTHFDWNGDKVCYLYLIQCDSCDKESLHLSWHDLRLFNYSGSDYRFSETQIDSAGEECAIDKLDLDPFFFYHQPTSFFTVDERVHHVIRELITEAEGCQKMNYLTGASACLRKAIYELLRKEGIGPDVGDYKERIKALKKKFSSVESSYFDVLANIKDMADDKLHEESWDSFDSSTLRELLAATKSILYEMYVLPEEKKSRLSIIPKLLEKLKKDKQGKQEKESSTIINEGK